MVIDPAGCDNPPMACKLDGRDREAQLRRWRELAAAAGAEPVAEPGRVISTWVLPAQGQRALRELVEAERQCCGFADFRLTFEGRSATLVITGPVGTEEFFDRLFG